MVATTRRLLPALALLALSPRLLSAQAAPSSASAPASEGEFGARAVVEASPVMGLELERDSMPSNVQVFGRAGLSATHSVSVPDALEQRSATIVLQDVQGNPLQPDLSYRGFTASPVLGTPQGIAVLQDGVRLNEPFGDVVQWDLIPMFAVGEIQLIPSGNVVFGQNSLGGSLALRMKTGYDPGSGLSLRASGGSFGRARATLQYGALLGGVAVYEGLGALHEQGFRDHSPSDAMQLYADVSHIERAYRVSSSLTLAASSLSGNGPVPVDLLARDRDALYTWPDITDNAMLLWSNRARVKLARDLALETTLYVRRLGRDTRNGDEADLARCDANALCGDDDVPLRDEQGRPLHAADAGDALLHTTDTTSTSYGAVVQSVWTAPFLHAGDQQLTAGASVDAADTSFEQHARIGTLTERREVVAQGPLVGGAAQQTRLGARNLAAAAYASETLGLGERVHLTLAARLNHTRIELEDRLGAALDGTHRFTRVNPAAGATYRTPLGFDVFGGYAEGSRAPSAAELACADPEQPCRVPNAFLSDPKLEQVVSRSVELGVRARHRLEPGMQVRFALSGFGARNTDDILFVAGARPGSGYFRNAGHTQRVGLEASVQGTARRFSWFASYALLHATFEDALVLPGDNHPGARTDAQGRRVLDVRPGARLPGLPEHSLKLGFDVELVPGLRIGPDARYLSSRPLRGDEANTLPPVAGHVVLDARASYRVLPWLLLFADVENLFDHDYETFGVLGQASEVLPYARDPRFLTPGAPFGAWFGVELGP